MNPKVPSRPGRLARKKPQPAYTAEAGARRQAGNISQRALQWEWEATHKGETFDPEWFMRMFYPAWPLSA